MRLEQTQQMLMFIEAITRQPFPAGAADAWWIMLQDIDYGDAMRAVQEWYNQPEAPKRDIYPGYILRRSREIARTRVESPARRAIEAAAAAAVPPNEAYRRMREELARRFGDSPDLVSRFGDLDRAAA